MENTLVAKPFKTYMMMHPRAFVLGTVSLLLTNTLDVMTPLALRAGIDAVTGKNPTALAHAILTYIALMVGVMFFRAGWRIFFGRFHHSVAEDLRNRIFLKLTDLGPSYYQRSSVGQLMSLITNDVNSFRMAIGPGMVTLFDAVFLMALILPVMISLSWDWTWKTMFLLPLIPFFMRHMEKLIHERYRVEQDRLSEVSARAQEIVSGIRIIKSFAQEKNQLGSFNAISSSYEHACNEMARVDALFSPVMRGAVALGSVALLWWGTPDVMRGTISIGTLVAFHEYVRRMVWPMSAVGIGVSMVEQGRASFDRIRDLLSTETDIPDTGTEMVSKFESLELRGLSFRYPNSERDALHAISLTIRAGETIGLVGPVGSGKTTLLQLISRLHPAAFGSVLINGRDVSEYKRASLSALISYVTQDVFLFSDTIAENMALGLPAFPGLEPVVEAAGVVNIDREIGEIPEQYSAYLGERGVNLSGGQKQRLTIARAIIRRSSVVMLDDSLSAVDGKTEKVITESLRAARVSGAAERDRTVILVSHRLATLKHADRIVVMNRGQIEAIGHHDELLATCDTYRRLNQLQSSQSALGGT